MKPKHPQTPKQHVKLPSIGNKTMGDIQKQVNKQKQRPSSSKNIVVDLEKKLFSHLDSYDQKTPKPQRASSKIKNKTNSTILSGSCKEIATKTQSIESDSMEKIAQLMPQLYSKIIQSKKYEDPKPLKQTFSFTNEEPSPKENTSIQMKKKPKQSPLLPSRSITRVPSAKSTKPEKQKEKQEKQVQSQTYTKSPQKQQEPSDSFDFAQKQIDSIYKEYLKMEGLENQKETSVSDLKEMNDSLSKCEVDIEELQRNYSNLIKQLGDICVNEIE